MSDVHMLITWLRCFDVDEQDQRMANKCADALEHASTEGERMRSLLESSVGCEYPKDCCHFPETSPTQSCCSWCLKRYEILYMTTVSGSLTPAADRQK